MKTSTGNASWDGSGPGRNKFIVGGRGSGGRARVSQNTVIMINIYIVLFSNKAYIAFYTAKEMVHVYYTQKLCLLLHIVQAWRIILAVFKTNTLNYMGICGMHEKPCAS